MTDALLAGPLTALELVEVVAADRDTWKVVTRYRCAFCVTLWRGVDLLGIDTVALHPDATLHMSWLKKVSCPRCDGHVTAECVREEADL